MLGRSFFLTRSQSALSDKMFLYINVAPQGVQGRYNKRKPINLVETIYLNVKKLYKTFKYCMLDMFLVLEQSSEIIDEFLTEMCSLKPLHSSKMVHMKALHTTM